MYGTVWKLDGNTIVDTYTYIYIDNFNGMGKYAPHIIKGLWFKLGN